MCDIDRELVLRGAAIFATYAAERQPPKLDPFVAGLIERALRSRIATPPVVEPSNGKLIGKKKIRRQRKVVDGRTDKRVARLLQVMRDAPERIFAPIELAKVARFPSPNESGVFHWFINRLVSTGEVAKIGRGQYQIAKAA